MNSLAIAAAYVNETDISHQSEFNITIRRDICSNRWWFIHWYFGRLPRGPDKLDFTRFSGNKFRSASAKGACRSSAPRARNELKSALAQTIISRHL
ncbi:hypothetical protein TNCV_525801 [Trichonephila clavipes]|nr:hypothetical protein TNCV_525801 [Trichonephila clavipes]